MPEDAAGYNKLIRLFDLRRKRYNAGLSDAEQAELNELNSWSAQGGYGIGEDEAAASAAGTAGAAPAPGAPLRPGFDPATEQAPEVPTYENLGEWAGAMKDAWQGMNPGLKNFLGFGAGLLTGGPMGALSAGLRSVARGRNERGDPTAGATPPSPEASDRAMGWGRSAPTPSRGLPSRAAPAPAPAPAPSGEGPDGGLAGEVADWGGHAPGHDYGGFAGTGEYRMGGYTGEGPDNELQPDEPAGTVHEGEFVIPTEAVEAIGLPTLERLRLMRKPDGGVMATMAQREPRNSGIPALDQLNDMPRKRTRGLAHMRKLGRVMPMGEG